ncbi:ABC transporter substrate-binding protein [Catenulispora yoronensis]|uniref:ABC transporter substrate-binding protein n=1 Tax=Catenulispora yoronensis TaxID=450799 RepID=A0ABN2TZJ5_9ACTN
MKLRTTLAALALASILLAAGCGSGSGGHGAGPAGTSGSPAHLDKVTLTLNWYPYGEHAALYYGLKTGVYRKYGIDLTIQAGQGSGKTVQAVGAGQSDFGWADTPALMQAVGKGVPVKSLGVFLQTTPASVQFFSDKGITGPADLKGKKVAGTAGDALSKTFPVFLQKNGMQLSDVSVQNTDAAGKLAAVISGQADALLGNANDQGPTIADKTGRPTTAMKFSDYGLTYYSDGLIASDGTVAKTDLATRMVKATSESFTAAAADPDAAVAAMAGSSQQLPSATVLKAQFATTLGLLHTAATTGKAPGADTEADWQATISVVSGAGLIGGSGKIGDYWAESVALKA